MTAMALVGLLGLVVLQTSAEIPAPVSEVLAALQDAVQQFAVEEEIDDFTLDDLLDSGLEAQPLDDGQGCLLNGVKVWLLNGKHRIFVVHWQGLWYLLELRGWKVFRVEGASEPDEAGRLFRTGKAVFVGKLRQ